jgi:hypothetical protein
MRIVSETKVMKCYRTMVRRGHLDGTAVPVARQSTSVLSVRDVRSIGRLHQRWQSRGVSSDLRQPYTFVRIAGQAS